MLKLNKFAPKRIEKAQSKVDNFKIPPLELNKQKSTNSFIDKMMESDSDNGSDQIRPINLENIPKPDSPKSAKLFMENLEQIK